MSRTYRRKGKAPNWVTKDWEWDSKHRRMYEVKLTGKALQKELASYHSDSPRWKYQGGIPGWFCTLWGHRPDRRAAKRALHKEYYALEKGDIVFDKQVDLAWQWW